MKKISPAARNGFINYAIIVAFFIVFQTLLSTGNLSSSFTGQLIPICAYIVMALSLNLVVGISGELSLGHAGFMSVGAFTGVIVATSLKNVVAVGPVRLALAILIGALLAAIVGVLIGIPVLRLQGDYLAIVTLAFGEIIKNILNCLYIGVDAKGLHFSMTDPTIGMGGQGTIILNGPMGAVGIQKLSTFVSGIILILIVLFIIQNLVNSRSGRAIKAIRDNRIAAESVGVNVTRYKLIAFTISAALAGLAGALYAHNFSSLVAKKFDYNTSILILVFVVVGGMGNIRGSIIAAALLTILPELLRGFSDYRMLVYAVVLIVMMLFNQSPQLVAWRRRLAARLPLPRKKAAAGEKEV